MLHCQTLVVLKWKVRAQYLCQSENSRNKAECRHWETNVPRPHAENAFVWYFKWVPFNGRKQNKTKQKGGGGEKPQKEPHPAFPCKQIFCCPKVAK